MLTKFVECDRTRFSEMLNSTVDFASQSGGRIAMSKRCMRKNEWIKFALHFPKVYESQMGHTLFIYYQITLVLFSFTNV